MEPALSGEAIQLIIIVFFLICLLGLLFSFFGLWLMAKSAKRIETDMKKIQDQLK